MKLDILRDIGYELIDEEGYDECRIFFNKKLKGGVLGKCQYYENYHIIRIALTNKEKKLSDSELILHLVHEIAHLNIYRHDKYHISYTKYLYRKIKKKIREV